MLAITAVSYTHLDVYKRQVIEDFKYEGSSDDLELFDDVFISYSNEKNIERRNGLFLIKPVVSSESFKLNEAIFNCFK